MGYNRNDNKGKIDLAGAWKKEGQYGVYYAGPIKLEALEELTNIDGEWEARVYKNTYHEKNPKSPHLRIVLVKKNKQANRPRRGTNDGDVPF